jgi:putative membrane protein
MKVLLKSTFIIAFFAVSIAAYAQKGTPRDKAFVAKVSQGGMFEVAAGKLAMSKGSTQDIIDFATAEVHDHMLVGAKLENIAAHAGITISPQPNAEFTVKLKYLSSLTGSKFDSAYLAEMASLHDKDGAAFAKEAVDGGNPALRAFGAETHRIVQRHIGAIRAVPAM